MDEQKLPVVRRMFYVVGVEGLPMHRVKKLFDSEGISPPKRGRYWSKQFIRSRIMDDAYKPHTFDEVKKLVSSEVAAKLEPEKNYGIWWYNVRRTIAKQIAETDGRRYRRRHHNHQAQGGVDSCARSRLGHTPRVGRRCEETDKGQPSTFVRWAPLLGTLRRCLLLWWVW